MPEKDDLCRWGCIDIDPQSYKDYSQKKVIDIQGKSITTSSS